MAVEGVEFHGRISAFGAAETHPYIAPLLAFPRCYVDAASGYV